jgi:hypothetical protein
MPGLCTFAPRRNVVGIRFETLVLQVEHVCATERARALLVPLLELERAVPAEAVVVARFQRAVGPFGEADAASVGLGDIVRVVQSVKDLEVVTVGGVGWLALEDACSVLEACVGV